MVDGPHIVTLVTTCFLGSLAGSQPLWPTGHTSLTLFVVWVVGRGDSQSEPFSGDSQFRAWPQLWGFLKPSRIGFL